MRTIHLLALVVAGLGALVASLSGADAQTYQVYCDGSTNVVQPDMTSVSGATLQSRIEGPVGPNLIKNGDFTYQADGTNMNIVDWWFLIPNAVSGPDYRYIKHWTGYGGGQETYVSWGGRRGEYWLAGTENQPGWIPVAQNAGAGASAVYMGNDGRWAWNGTAPQLNSDGFGLGPNVYFYNQKYPNYGDFSNPPTITQTVTGLKVGTKYRLQWWQGGEGRGWNKYIQPGIYAFDITGYTRTFSLIQRAPTIYRTIDFVAKFSTTNISYINWGHINITGPPNVYGGISGADPAYATELVIDDVILTECRSTSIPQEPLPLTPIQGACAGDLNVAGDWRTAAVSSSGMQMIVAPVNGELQVSSDKGIIFTQATGTGGAQSWAGLAQSSDGSEVCAVTTDGKTFTSTDGGLSFTQSVATTGVTGWTAVAAATNDFSVLVATATDGKIYRSTDGGQTWTASTGSPVGSHTWSSIASSGDGNTMLATDNGGKVYVSLDKGLSWTEQTYSPNTGDWVGATVSRDGTAMAVVDANGGLWTNYDGTGWVRETNLGTTLPFTAIDMSADGQTVFATTSPGYIYVSRDGGQTWAEDTSAGTQQWTSISVSEDGTVGLATTLDGYVYKFPPPPSPPTPGTCSQSPLASASAPVKVAPARSFKYTATLFNSQRASAGASSLGYNIKAPFFNATFSMQLPDGVTLKSATSFPKMKGSESTPSVTCFGLLTWPLAVNVKPGAKIKVALKLAAAQCTTPASLPLVGQFMYIDSVGPKAVDACLKKDVYVWANSCAPIPKPTKPTSPSMGTKPGESWNLCDCNVCKCNGKTCDCPQNSCTCTPIPA